MRQHTPRSLDGKPAPRGKPARSEVAEAGALDDERGPVRSFDRDSLPVSVDDADSADRDAGMPRRGRRRLFAVGRNAENQLVIVAAREQGREVGLSAPEAFSAGTFAESRRQWPTCRMA